MRAGRNMNAAQAAAAAALSGGMGMPDFGNMGGMGMPGGIDPQILAQMFGGGGDFSDDIEGSAVAQEQDDGVDRSRWNIIYPTYLNKKRTIGRGRRVSSAHAVDDPLVEEMKLVCDHLQIPSHVEARKRYSRDWLFSVGRIRYLLKNEDGVFYNEEVKTKRELLYKMGELIPQLNTRNLTQTNPAAGGGRKKKKGK